MGAGMIILIEILVEILQGIGSLFTRSRSDIDRIERQITRREQHRRRR
jgi:hypothetical protein